MMSNTPLALGSPVTSPVTLRFTVVFARLLTTNAVLEFVLGATNVVILLLLLPIVILPIGCVSVPDPVVGVSTHTPRRTISAFAATTPSAIQALL
jgi:hypothetical protein